MEIRIKYILIVLILIVSACSKPDNMNKSFESAIGKYKCKAPYGGDGYRIELLELRKDTTYKYTLKYSNGVEYEATGTWKYRKSENDPWWDTMIDFYDWPKGIDPTRQINPTLSNLVKIDKTRKGKVSLAFLIEIVSFKWVYILRREIDAQSSTDFIKNE